MTEEKSLVELLLSEAKSIDQIGSKESTTFKVLIERFRYKQDCRKRSIDLAHNELELLMREAKGADFNTTEVADKYYEWLISIPEK